MPYLKRFFSFKCSGDLLQCVAPINNGPKEITEAMAIRRIIAPIILKKPQKYVIFDVCSGNALVPVITSFTLPVLYSYAFDKIVRKRKYHLIKEFQYIQGNLHSSETIDIINDIKFPIILTAVHPCGNLASRCIELYNSINHIKHLVIMPCCYGKYDKKPFKDKNTQWLKHLIKKIKTDYCICLDGRIYSEKNFIIVTNKENYV